jgi:2-hydroxy-3-keto-5-methylthiopentenyl-1-phosphate phosphatase
MRGIEGFEKKIQKFIIQFIVVYPGLNLFIKLIFCPIYPQDDYETYKK